MMIDPDAPLRFLRTAYDADDWIAVFLKSYANGQTIQRVGPRSLFLRPDVHAWLRAMNARQYNCYVAVNTITHGVRARTKRAIGQIRHVFIETDTDGAALLATLASRRDLPPPSYVIQSSPNRLHVLWRVCGFTPESVGRLQKYLARHLRTDIAATSCTQTTRLPGYGHHERQPAMLVTVHYVSSDRRRHSPDAFPQAPGTPTASALPVLQRPSHLALVDRIERARRYLPQVPPAAGQRGDVHTYRVCCRIVRGLALDDG